MANPILDRHISATFSDARFLLQHQAPDDTTDRVQEREHVEDTQGARNNVLEAIRLVCGGGHQTNRCHYLHILNITAAASTTNIKDIRSVKLKRMHY